ncbi:heat- and acid-stable phosphoprotein [Nymphon striatum]|nr:heat- and acid-stable phosphoprotein [Nymphon striatum]
MVILVTNDIDQYDPLPAIRLWNSAGSKPRRPCTAPYGVRSCNADLESDNECNSGKRGHKGQRRHFTSIEQVEADKEKEERQKNWKKTKDDDDDDEEGSEEESSSEESSSDEDNAKAKGVSHLIEVSNPNYCNMNKAKKLSQLDEKAPDDSAAKPQLTRREREEIEKQQAKAKYNALHAAGKTEEARTDLARLAIIRQQREDAAKKKEVEKKALEAKKKPAKPKS